MLTEVNIGVVIINYNSAKYLLKALSTLAQQTYQPVEVIILDNASNEELPSNIFETKLNLKLIKSTTNLGFAAGNNFAIQNLDKSVNWIALLNPDAYPDQNWLAEMVKIIRSHPSYTFLGSKLLCETEPNLLDGTGDAYHISGKAWRMLHKKPIHQASSELKEIFSPCAAAALYRRDIFEEAEGFDESFFCYYEDIDLAFRLRLLGYKCCYVPTAIATHTGSATTKRHSDFYTYHGHRNLVWTYLKNMPGFLLFLSLPLHIMLNIVSILIISSRGQTNTILKSKFDALRGFKTIFKQRIKWQKKRVVSHKELLKILHKGFPW